MKRTMTLFVVVLSFLVLSGCDFFGEEVVKSGSSNVATNNDNTNNVNNMNNSNDTNNSNNTNNTNETNNINVELCGNGVLDDGELCDSVANDGSLAEEIHFAPGSMNHNCAEDEEPVFACTSSCNIEVECIVDTEAPRCGDGVVNQDSEECDGTVPDTCASLYGSDWIGTVVCSGCQLEVNCWLDNSNTNTAVCGNGNAEAGEQCDGSDFNGLSCSSYGYNSGSLVCSNCQIGIGNCYNTNSAVCGDGNIDSGEQCDGSNFGGLSCSDYGFDSGNLSCLSSCGVISTSGCYNSQSLEPVVCLQADSGYRLYGMVITMDDQLQWFSKNPGEIVCGRQIKFNAVHQTIADLYMIGWLLQCSLDMADYDMDWTAVQVWVNPSYGQVVDNTSCPSNQPENYSVAGTTKKVCGDVSYGIVSDNSSGGGINLLIGELGYFQSGTDYFTNCTPGEERLYWGQNNSVPH